MTLVSLKPSFANDTHEKFPQQELPKLGNSNFNDKNFHAFTCQPGDDQVDMEDEDALLAGLEMPILSLQKPSIFNIKADQQVTVMEDFDDELPEPMPTF